LSLLSTSILPWIFFFTIVETFCQDLAQKEILWWLNLKSQVNGLPRGRNIESFFGITILKIWTGHGQPTWNWFQSGWKSFSVEALYSCVHFLPTKEAAENASFLLLPALVVCPVKWVSLTGANAHSVALNRQSTGPIPCITRHLSDICVDGSGIGRASDRFPGSGSCQWVATFQHLFAFLLKNQNSVVKRVSWSCVAIFQAVFDFCFVWSFWSQTS